MLDGEEDIFVFLHDVNYGRLKKRKVGNDGVGQI